MNSALSSGICSRARIAQNITRSLILMAGMFVDALMRARRASKPAAPAEAFKVYCAVEANDSRMRRAILSRILDGRVARGTGATGAGVLGARGTAAVE